MQSAAEAGDQDRRIPRLAPDWDPSGRALSPAEGFLLSRIDGRTPWAVLLQIGGLAPEEIESCLNRWMEEGVVQLTDVGDPGGGGPPNGQKSSPGPVDSESGGKANGSGAVSEDAIDPELDLSVELQRRILEFEANLEQPYHALLGVDRSADSRAIKRAYFELSRQFHPDRYFRRQVGEYAPRLERIFKKVVEAYELLSDPMTRAEIERSTPNAPPPPKPEAPAGVADGADGSAPGPQQSARRQRLERLRRQFRIPDEILAERRFKAQQFFEAAMVSKKKERWLEAAASIRLAIAFHPGCDEYRKGFGEVQARVHELRAADLLEQAKGAWDDSARIEAMKLYDEALHYRPGDPQINDRAAQLALEINHLDSAREYAETACEVAPEVSGYRVTLARVYSRQGLADKATKALEEAMRIDPDDSRARKELESMRRRGRQANQTGGMR
jgi:tetratricopeptide (TPR) repeat protein